uniref:Protein kinase domain-containing protein n=1 Tax=Kalanchoe fedtschenkoi TaxID=63787 RepID=A0A7N0TV25_KALFE
MRDDESIMENMSDMQEIGTFLSFASRGDRVGLNLMLRNGISPDVQDYDSRTALHLAASEGHASIVELLLHYGANLNLKDRWQRTPLTDARFYGHRDICRILEVNKGKDFINDHPLTMRHQKDSNEVNIDITELKHQHSTKVKQGVFGESEKVKWRGTWVIKTVVSKHIEKPVKMILSTRDNTLLRELRHPNIVQFLGSSVGADEMILVTEFLSKGTLDGILDRKGRLDLPTAVGYALDIAKGMNYLHEHKPLPILHNYLDPKNLLQDEGSHLKIGEYWVQMLYDEKGQVNNLSSKRNTSYPSSKEEDVRSFGFIFHQMLEGRSNTISIFNLRSTNFQPKFELSKCPGIIQQLIERCSSIDPSNRPSFESVISTLEEVSASLGRTSWLQGVLGHECSNQCKMTKLG